MRIATLLIAGLGLLTPVVVSAQRAISVGLVATAPPIGAEVVWTDPSFRAGVAVAVGLSGIGARALVFSGNVNDAGLADARAYGSIGYVATPWKVGRIDARGAAVLEGGEQLWPRAGHRIFFDLGAGAYLVQGGTWGGNTAGVAIRFQCGLVV